MLRAAGYETTEDGDTMTAINTWLHKELDCFVELSLAPDRTFAVHTAMRIANGDVKHFSEYNQNGRNFATAEKAFDHGAEMLLYHHLFGKWPNGSDINTVYGRLLR